VLTYHITSHEKKKTPPNHLHTLINTNIQLETKPSRLHGKRPATSASIPKMSREERRQRDSERYSKTWAKNLESHVPISMSGGEEQFKTHSEPSIPVTNQHRTLLAGSDVRSCLVHRNRASRERVENEHRDRHGQRISRIRRMNLVQRETNPDDKSLKDRLNLKKKIDRRDLLQTNHTILPGSIVPRIPDSSKNRHTTMKRPGRPNQTNASRGVAESLQPRTGFKNKQTSSQRRHFVSAEDFRNLPSPSTTSNKQRMVSKSLQKLRDVLPQGKASAHRVLIHRFRKFDLQFTGEIDATAFRRGLSSFGTTWNTTQMHHLLRDLDRKRSGFVDYRAFADKVTNMSRLSSSTTSSITSNRKTSSGSQKKHFESYKADWENRDASTTSSRVRVLRSKVRPPVGF